MAASRSSQAYPSTPAEFIQRFPHHERNTIHSISQSLARASGSRWTANHLESCRVILKPPRPHMKHLDIFQGYLEPARMYIKNCRDIFEPLTAVSPKLLKECSFAELRKIGGGFGAFYVRLAEVVRMPPPEKRIQPSRDVRQPDRQGFVTGEGLGFSSPLGTETSGQQSSPFSPSESDPVERSDHALRTKHETVTAGMAAEFISSVLDLCCEQSSQYSRIEFATAPTTYNMRTKWFQTTCQDDGSLIRRYKSKFSGLWSSRGDILAIVEAKAQYTSWNEDEDIAQVSYNVLAQQVCEMKSSLSQRIDLEGVLEDLTHKDRQILLLSVHQSTLTFMHWAIEDDYINYLRSDKPAQALPFLELCISAAFNLEKIDERLEAVLGVIALVSFFNDEDRMV